MLGNVKHIHHRQKLVALSSKGHADDELPVASHVQAELAFRAKADQSPPTLESTYVCAVGELIAEASLWSVRMFENLAENSQIVSWFDQSRAQSTPPPPRLAYLAQPRIVRVHYVGWNLCTTKPTESEEPDRLMPHPYYRGLLFLLHHTQTSPTAASASQRARGRRGSVIPDDLGGAPQSSIERARVIRYDMLKGGGVGADEGQA